ncbi:probable pectinesterase 53 [Gastrolobium bilobum]|uniref:probable pectinesterase 53 n=1 Tax=Gastrolobium bilobum TaxID=150636 RepID=UPI002AB0EC99|nr:probable pectinesterase 53 [Gastrolobium bilobum]
MEKELGEMLYSFGKMVYQHFAYLGSLRETEGYLQRHSDAQISSVFKEVQDGLSLAIPRWASLCSIVDLVDIVASRSCHSFNGSFQVKSRLNCYVNSITKKVASITAQKRTNSTLESGFSFKNGVVTGSGQVYLGRAWGEYSRVVYSYTYLDTIVHPKGWSDWGDKKRDLRVYYGEYKCSGPGANLTGRVPWARMLTDEDAKPFIGIHFIEGDTWLISPFAYPI